MVITAWPASRSRIKVPFSSVFCLQQCLPSNAKEGTRMGEKRRGKRKKTHIMLFEAFLILPSHLPAGHVWSLLLLPGSFSVWKLQRYLKSCKTWGSQITFADAFMAPLSITNILFRMRSKSLIFPFWGDKNLGFEWFSLGSWKRGVSLWVCVCIFACPQVFELLISQRTISFSRDATCKQCKDTF